VTLTELGDVSTVAKTLVEAFNDVLQNLDTTGSVNSSVVYVDMMGMGKRVRFPPQPLGRRKSSCS